MISAIKTILQKVTKQVEDIEINQLNEHSSDELTKSSTESSSSSISLFLVEESMIDFDIQPFIPKSYLLRNKPIPSSPISSDSSDDSSEEIEIVTGHVSHDENQIKYSERYNTSKINYKDLQVDNQSSFYSDDDQSFIKRIPEYQGSIRFTQTDKSLNQNHALRNKKKGKPHKLNSTPELAYKNNKKNSDKVLMESPSSISKTVQFGPKLPKSNENDIDVISIPIKTILKKESPSNNKSNIQDQIKHNKIQKKQNKLSNENILKTKSGFEYSIIEEVNNGSESIPLSSSNLNVNINISISCNSNDFNDGQNNGKFDISENNLNLSNCPTESFNQNLLKQKNENFTNDNDDKIYNYCNEEQFIKQKLNSKASIEKPVYAYNFSSPNEEQENFTVFNFA